MPDRTACDSRAAYLATLIGWATTVSRFASYELRPAALFGPNDRLATDEPPWDVLSIITFLSAVTSRAATIGVGYRHRAGYFVSADELDRVGWAITR